MGLAPDLVGVPLCQAGLDLPGRSVSVSARVQVSLVGIRPHSRLAGSEDGHGDGDFRWTIEDDVEFFVGCSLRNSACAGMTISKASTKTWIAMLFAMLRAVGAPDFLKMLFASMVVTKQPPQLAATNSIFKSSTPDFARSMMRRTAS